MFGGSTTGQTLEAVILNIAKRKDEDMSGRGGKSEATGFADLVGIGGMEIGGSVKACDLSNTLKRLRADAFASAQLHKVSDFVFKPRQTFTPVEDSSPIPRRIPP